MIEDLNDYLYFAQVVKHGGFAAAGRALQIPKSKLSRRVAGLEERLGTRLIERSSHRFRVTELGQTFYQHCLGMLVEAERAKTVICQSHGEPRGPVRLSCPSALLDVSLAAMLPEFLERYPLVLLQVLATDRRVDLVEERVHVAIRSGTSPETETDLTMRMLGKTRSILVGSPAFIEKNGPFRCFESLEKVPTLSMKDPISGWVDDETWVLDGPDGQRHSFNHRPRFACKSVPALLEAVKAGAGVGLLPESICSNDLDAGTLIPLFPGFVTAESSLYLVFTTARGLPPAVRVLIDFLVERFRVECPEAVEPSRLAVAS
jgi:DNA-binding transcriptional LysR family regulator